MYPYNIKVRFKDQASAEKDSKSVDGSHRFFLLNKRNDVINPHVICTPNATTGTVDITIVLDPQ